MASVVKEGTDKTFFDHRLHGFARIVDYFCFGFYPWPSVASVVKERTDKTFFDHRLHGFARIVDYFCFGFYPWPSVASVVKEGTDKTFEVRKIASRRISPFPVFRISTFSLWFPGWVPTVFQPILPGHSSVRIRVHPWPVPLPAQAHRVATKNGLSRLGLL